MSDAVRDIWNSEKFQQQQQQHRQNYQQIARQAQPAVQHHQQQFYCTLQYQPLILRTEYQRRMLQSPPPPPPPPPVLSAEVPEFFPKSSLPSITTYNINGNKEHRAYQIRYFPSLNDRNYQSELFPYNRPQQEIATTVFPVSEVYDRMKSRINNLFFAIVIYSFSIEHQNVYITSDRNEHVPFTSGMDPKGRTAGAVTINSVFFVISTDLHVFAIDSRRYDRPSSFAGIFLIK